MWFSWVATAWSLLALLTTVAGDIQYGVQLVSRFSDEFLLNEEDAAWKIIRAVFSESS